MPLLGHPLLVLLFKEARLFLKQVSNVLQETFLVVEDVVLVLDEGDSKDVEDALRTREGLAAQRILREPLDQVVAHLCVDEVLLLPLQVDELLLRWQVKVQQALDELGPLKGLKPSRANQVTFAELQNHGPVPLAPVFNAQDSCGAHPILVL